EPAGGGPARRRPERPGVRPALRAGPVKKRAPARLPWPEANQRHLLAALARVRAALRRHAGTEPAEDGAAADEEALARAMEAPPALARVVETFGLSPFERDVLLLCAGVELDAAFAAAVRAAGEGARPTFALALAALEGGHWSALAPGAPLRWWRLV